MRKRNWDIFALNRGRSHTALDWILSTVIDLFDSTSFAEGSQVPVVDTASCFI